jgi:hypothetical protein
MERRLAAILAADVVGYSRLIRFRRFISGSLALASLDLTCRDIAPTFLQTLTTIALYDRSSQWLGIIT